MSHTVTRTSDSTVRIRSHAGDLVECNQRSIDAIESSRQATHDVVNSAQNLDTLLTRYSLEEADTIIGKAAY